MEEGDIASLKPGSIADDFYQSTMYRITRMYRPGPKSRFNSSELLLGSALRVLVGISVFSPSGTVFLRCVPLSRRAQVTEFRFA